MYSVELSHSPTVEVVLPVPEQRDFSLLKEIQYSVFLTVIQGFVNKYEPKGADNTPKLLKYTHKNYYLPLIILLPYDYTYGMTFSNGSSGPVRPVIDSFIFLSSPLMFFVLLADHDGGGEQRFVPP
jgi:hypothetical protein